MDYIITLSEERYKDLCFLLGWNSSSDSRDVRKKAFDVHQAILGTTEEELANRPLCNVKKCESKAAPSFIWCEHHLLTK